MGERSTIEGTVENVVFQNEENGYTVLSLLTDQGEVVTVVGCIPFAAAGESMTVTGVWVNHPTYGVQMTAELVERRMPQDEEGIICYLASGVLKGVGPATATRLVDKFGTDTLRVIEEEPEKLTTLKGITSKKAMEISAAFRSLTGLAGDGVFKPLRTAGNAGHGTSARLWRRDAGKIEGQPLSPYRRAVRRGLLRRRRDRAGHGL